MPVEESRVLKDKLHELNINLGKEMRERISTKQELDQLTADYEHLQVEKEALEEQTVEHKKYQDHCTNEMESLKQQLAACNHKIHDLEQEVTLLRNQPSASQVENAFGGGDEVLTIPSTEIVFNEKKLGKGSYGGIRFVFQLTLVFLLYSRNLEVKLAHWLGCPVAVKQLHDLLADSKRNIDLIKQEVTVAWKIHHPNVVAVCGVVLELEDEKVSVWIVMELLEGSVSDVLDVSQTRSVRSLSLKEMVDMTYDALCGIRYLHSMVSFRITNSLLLSEHHPAMR